MEITTPKKTNKVNRAQAFEEGVRDRVHAKPL